MSTLITEAHRSKPAYIYVRQSTLAQVRHHQVRIPGHPGHRFQVMPDSRSS